MDMYRKNIRPRDIMTKDAILNALTVDMALGCSTNSMLHLPAIAHEIGFDFDIAFANPISEKTPNLCHLAPAGPTYMEDLNEAGGVYAVMKELADIGLLNTDCMTVTGKTVGENIANAVNKNPEVIRPVDNPYSKTGGLAVLKGNLAPDGSVVKRSAVCDEMMVHEGPARVFDCEEDAIAAIKGGKIVAGDVVVIRYEGPKGGPGMREMLNPTSAIAGMGLGSSVALITDGRFFRREPWGFHRTCFTGGSSRRTNRTCGRGRYHPYQYSGDEIRDCSFRRRNGSKKSKMAAERAKGNDRLSETLCIVSNFRQQRCYFSIAGRTEIKNEIQKLSFEKSYVVKDASDDVEIKNR